MRRTAVNEHMLTFGEHFLTLFSTCAHEDLGTFQHSIAHHSMSFEFHGAIDAPL